MGSGESDIVKPVGPSCRDSLLRDPCRARLRAALLLSACRNQHEFSWGGRYTQSARRTGSKWWPETDLQSPRAQVGHFARPLRRERETWAARRESWKAQSYTRAVAA